jgi:chitinase
MNATQRSFAHRLGVVLLAAGVVASAGRATAQEPIGGGGAPSRLMGYFTSWSIYGRNYVVKNIKDSGAAPKVTHILYAFAKISPDLKCEISDPWADYQKPFDASQSVDGVAETWSDTQIRGNFNQLRKLRMQFPSLKLVMSVGGFTFSDKFSDAALTPESRATLASSCIDMFINGNVAPGVSSPGSSLFDGIDIDWEFPGACGNTCNFRPEDTQNFTALLAEFRRQLDVLGAASNKHYLLTIAAPAGQWLFTKIELDKIHPYLDAINLLTYDFHGSWEMSTNVHSPLLPSPADPGGPTANADFTVRSYLAAGIPASKLGLGVPFYGRGWSGVPNINHGIYQQATGFPQGTFDVGIDDFRNLEPLKAQGFLSFRDLRTQGHWIYNPATGIFWGYDDAITMRSKATYVAIRRLGGAMFWDFSNDDVNGSLVKALREGVNLLQ